MNKPIDPGAPKRKYTGVTRTELVLVSIGVALVIGLYGFAARQQIKRIPTITVPIVGEWQASDKPLHLSFFPDKRVVLSSTSRSPSEEKESAAAITTITVPGIYAMGAGGTVGVKLDNGAKYTVEWKALTPNRFDLIDAETQGVTTFDKAK